MAGRTKMKEGVIVFTKVLSSVNKYTYKRDRYTENGHYNKNGEKYDTKYNTKYDEGKKYEDEYNKADYINEESQENNLQMLYRLQILFAVKKENLKKKKYLLTQIFQCSFV